MTSSLNGDKSQHVALAGDLQFGCCVVMRLCQHERSSRLGHPETDTSGKHPASHDERSTGHSRSGCPQVDENIGGEPGEPGDMASGRQTRPPDDLRQRGPMAVEAPRWVLWAIITAAVAYAALSLLAVIGTAMPDPCDHFHESPGACANW